MFPTNILPTKCM